MTKLWMIVSAVVLFCLTTTTVSATGLRTHGGAGSLDGSMTGTECDKHNKDCSACLAASHKCKYTVKQKVIKGGETETKGDCAWSTFDRKNPTDRDICKDKTFPGDKTFPKFKGKGGKPILFSPNVGMAFPIKLEWPARHDLFPHLYTDGTSKTVDTRPRYDAKHPLTRETYNDEKIMEACIITKKQLSAKEAKHGAKYYNCASWARRECDADLKLSKCMAEAKKDSPKEQACEKEIQRPRWQNDVQTCNEEKIEKIDPKIEKIDTMEKACKAAATIKYPKAWKN